MHSHHLGFPSHFNIHHTSAFAPTYDIKLPWLKNERRLFKAPLERSQINLDFYENKCARVINSCLRDHYAPPSYFLQSLFYSSCLKYLGGVL